MNALSNTATAAWLHATSRFRGLIVIFMVVGLLSPVLAQAQYCLAATGHPGTDVKTPMPAKINPRLSDPVGREYFTVTATQPGYHYARCLLVGRSADTLEMVNVGPADSNGYFPSNIAGLGWKIRRGGSMMTATVQRTIGPGDVYSTTTAWALSLVRTGGTLGTGDVFGPMIRGSFDMGFPRMGVYWRWTMSNNSVIAIPTCSVSATGATITIGSRVTTDMPQVGKFSTTSPASNVRLSCANSLRVDMRLTTAPIAGTPNVLPLTGSATGRAGGIGVQLIYGGNVMAYNTAYRVSSAAPGTLDIPLAARYYRTGALTAGTANSTAVLEFTYP